jgi:predicted transposase YbfD/YdcC
VRSLVVVTKQVSGTGVTAGKESERSVSHYVSSLVPQSARRFAQLVRGHWGGCEIRNHWVRDALFEEDRTRIRNLNINGNLAVLRSAVIALKARHAGHLKWPSVFELSSHRATYPYNLVCNNTFK